jgi:hypothetical protein
MIRPTYAHEAGGRDPRRVRNAGNDSPHATPMLPVYYNGKPLAGNHGYGGAEDFLASTWKDISGQTHKEQQEKVRKEQDERFAKQLAQMTGSVAPPSAGAMAMPLVAILVGALGFGWLLTR